MVELQAELQARGLMTEGSRREIYKRVQVRASSHPEYSCISWIKIHRQAHSSCGSRRCQVFCLSVYIICMVQAARRSSAAATSVAEQKRKQAVSHAKYVRERSVKETKREAEKKETARLEVRVAASCSEPAHPCSWPTVSILPPSAHHAMLGFPILTGW